MGHPTKDFRNNWHPDWMPVLECGVKRVMAEGRYGTNLCDVEELVNVLWLQCMRRRSAEDKHAYKGCWSNLNGTTRFYLYQYGRKVYKAGGKLWSYSWDDFEDLHSPDNTLESVEVCDTVSALLTGLTERQKVILLSRLEGRSVLEIAEGFGLSGQAIRNDLDKIGKKYLRLK